MAGQAGLAVVVDSAGTGDWHVGAPPHPPMIAAAARRGYDLRPLRARQVQPQDFLRFDRIVVMDSANLRDVMRLRQGQGAAPELFLSHAAHTGLTDLPDPYFTGDFDQTLDLVEAAAAGLIRALQAGHCAQ